MNPPSVQSPVEERPAPAQDATVAPNHRHWMFLGRVIIIVALVVLGYKLIRVALYGLSAYNSALSVMELRKDGDLSGQDLIRARRIRGRRGQIGGRHRI